MALCDVSLISNLTIHVAHVFAIWVGKNQADAVLDAVWNYDTVVDTKDAMYDTDVGLV